ncbi:MAG TPA: response regulator [Actinomycetota bacterium]|jgi:two-component system, response regulator PdtaR|nr:response regulator [Actinomycetota bacterium]
MGDGSGRKVLIAEDEAIIRLDLKEMLEEEGFDVVGEAADGDAAVRLTRDRSPDLVIMDVKMPGRDGLSAAEAIAEDDLAAVLILTAFSQRDLVRRAADAGAMGYLVKPFQKSDLLPAIEIALARRAELVAVRRESESLGEQLETRKLVDRAKGRLMDEGGLSEADAFRHIQKQAMDRRLSMRAVAEEVLQERASGPEPLRHE